MPEYVLHSDAEGRGPSVGLWGKCPILDILQHPGKGFIVQDDFVNGLPTGKYTATQATAGTFALDDAVGGVALLDCNSTTAAQGINVQLGSTVGEIIKPAADSIIYYESRVKAADIATGPEFFLGLHEIDTTIIAASAMSGSNFIGFQSVTDDGVLLFAGEKAGTGTTKSSTTLVDDEWVKLGFIVYGTTKIEQFINGVKQSETIVTANIPVVEMTISAVCQSGGTTDPIVHWDWYRCVQQFM